MNNLSFKRLEAARARLIAIRTELAELRSDDPGLSGLRELISTLDIVINNFTQILIRIENQKVISHE